MQHLAAMTFEQLPGGLRSDMGDTLEIGEQRIRRGRLLDPEHLELLAPAGMNHPGTLDGDLLANDGTGERAEQRHLLASIDESHEDRVIAVG